MFLLVKACDPPCEQDVRMQYKEDGGAKGKGMVTAAADELAYGQAWLVPTNPPLTVRQLAARFAQVNGAPRAKVTQIPYPVMWVSGLFSPLIRELRTTRYQFTRPFVLDASATTDVFGLQPITMDEALRDAAARLRARSATTSWASPPSPARFGARPGPNGSAR